MRFAARLLSAVIFISFTFATLTSCKREPARSLYDLSIVYEEGKIEGKLVYKFVNSYDSTFNHILFNLHANAYKEGAIHRPTTQSNEVRAYPDGISYGKIDILGVRADNKTAEWTLLGEDCEFLKVTFDRLKKGDSISIEIDFHVDLPNSALRLGENQNGVNLADFFPVACKIKGGDFMQISYAPVGDPFFADLHDYEVDITVPSEYTVASSGYPTLTAVDGVSTTYSYELKNGRDFAFLLSKNYRVQSVTADGTVLTYYGFGDDGKEMLELMTDCVDFFSKSFGKYQYKSLSLAECQLALGGMEYTGLCFINCSLQKEDKITVAVHEIAHSWWHSMIGNDQSLSGYLDEGLCEYSTYLYVKNRIDKSLANDMINSTKLSYKSFFTIEETLSGDVNTAMERELDSFKSEYEYSSVAYSKSLIMFYEYGIAIGEDKAVKNLADFYKKNLFGVADLNSLISALGYGEHFRSFVEGKVLI